MKKIIIDDCIHCPLFATCKEIKKLKSKTRLAMMTNLSYAKGILKTCPLKDDVKKFKKADTFGQEGEWQIDPTDINKVLNKAFELGFYDSVYEENIDDTLMAIQAMSYLELEE